MRRQYSAATKSRLMSKAELRRRLALVLSTRQPNLWCLAKLSGIDDQVLKHYGRGQVSPAYERSLVLSDIFRKMDLGIYELYQRPQRRGFGVGNLIWDLRVSTNPRPPVSACVTFDKFGPKLRFKSTAELLGIEVWQPHESAELLSSKLTESSKSIVV